MQTTILALLNQHIRKGKKVGSVEKVPDCDDDKHGVIYIYDENEELIEAIKY